MFRVLYLITEIITCDSGGSSGREPDDYGGREADDYGGRELDDYGGREPNDYGGREADDNSGEETDKSLNCDVEHASGDTMDRLHV